MRQYRCKYFKIKELVHPSFLTTNENILWMLFDERVLKGADRIRELYGACTVNVDGLTDCGLRKMGSKTGAKYSAHCFDSDTEMLTANGWKKYSDLSVGEKIYSFNMDSGCIEDDVINELITQKYTGKMVTIKNTCVDICVTDLHQLVLKKKNGQYTRISETKKGNNIANSVYLQEKKKPYKKENAIDVIGKRKEIICSAIKTDGLNYVDLFDMFICAFVCDGFYISTGVIGFNFIKERKITRVRQLLNKLGVKYVEIPIKRKENAGVHFRISDKSFVKRVRETCGQLKKLPIEWLSRNGDAIGILLKELIFYDGNADCRTGCSSMMFVTTNKHNSDVVSAMGCVSGFRTIITYKKPIETNWKPQYVIHLVPRTYVRHETTRPNNIEYVENVKDKIVWCIRSNNRTLIVRRNGKICISGNCFGRALDLHIRSIELEGAKIKSSVERKKWKIKEYNKVRERLMIMPEFDYLVFENGISWLHVACQNRENRLFNP